ncbi:MAG: TetR/AcrR family transcriptional regulator C-terminal domain-containing protein [Eubacteriales bacterium]
MKQRITSLNTKNALSASLKRFMERKPLSKISVSEIVSDCGVNRKTFYYHFTDIYDLLRWTLDEEAIEVVKKMDLLTNTEEAIAFVLDYIDGNKHIIACAYDSMGHEEIKRFFYKDFISVTKGVIEEAEREHHVTLEESIRDFIVMFFTEAIAGCLINYIQSKKKPTKTQIIGNLMTVYNGMMKYLITEKNGISSKACK